MQLKVVWREPVILRDASADGLIYSLPSLKVPTQAGIYIFGRKHGNSFEALYVGKASNLQRRAQQQMKNLRLMVHLRDAKNGSRAFLAGVLNTTSGNKVDKGLPILERAFIRYFLAEGHDLVNIHGTRFLRHEVLCSGSNYLPETMLIDAGTP